MAIALPGGIALLLGSFVEPAGASRGGASQAIGSSCTFVGGLALLALSARASIGGVRVRGGEVVMRNVFATRRFPVSDVVVFVVGPGFLGRGTCGAVDLRDGSSRRATFLGGDAVVGGGRALTRALEQLDERLARERQRA